MSSNQSDPPSLAIWWLRHACPGSDNEVLTGDLIERFREGQTRGWLWRQVLIAFALGLLGEIRRHWPHFCYAIAGGVMTWFSFVVTNSKSGIWGAHALRHLPDWLHWYDLPWPWSQLVFELSRAAYGVLAALSVLAAGLIIERSFHWFSLLRTGVINLALIALGLYSFDLFPWLLRSVPDGDHHQVFRFPRFGLVLWFSTFLVAAWLGCLSPRHSDKLEEL